MTYGTAIADAVDVNVGENAILFVSWVELGDRRVVSV